MKILLTLSVILFFLDIVLVGIVFAYSQRIKRNSSVKPMSKAFEIVLIIFIALTIIMMFSTTTVFIVQKFL